MRRLLPIPILICLLVLVASTAPAQAAVSPPLGRVVTSVDPPGGHGVCSIQGERVDANNNGFAEGIRARAACKESFGILRYRINWVQLSVDFADTWFPLVRRDLDAVSTNQPAYVISTTPVDLFCRGDTTTLTYRATASVSVRGDNGVVVSRTIASNQFQGRRTQHHPDCPD